MREMSIIGSLPLKGAPTPIRNRQRLGALAARACPQLARHDILSNKLRQRRDVAQRCIGKGNGELFESFTTGLMRGELRCAQPSKNRMSWRNFRKIVRAC